MPLNLTAYCRPTIRHTSFDYFDIGPYSSVNMAIVLRVRVCFALNVLYYSHLLYIRTYCLSVLFIDYACTFSRFVGISVYNLVVSQSLILLCYRVVTLLRCYCIFVLLVTRQLFVCSCYVRGLSFHFIYPFFFLVFGFLIRQEPNFNFSAGVCTSD